MVQLGNIGTFSYKPSSKEVVIYCGFDMMPAASNFIYILRSIENDFNPEVTVLKILNLARLAG